MPLPRMHRSHVHRWLVIVLTAIILPLSFVMVELLLRTGSGFADHGPWAARPAGDFVVAALAAAFATVVGSLLAAWIWRGPVTSSASSVTVGAPLIVVVLAIAAVTLVPLTGRIDLIDTLPVRIMVHALLGSPVVAVAVMVTLVRSDPWLLRSAACGGATPWRAVSRVMLPVIAPAAAIGIVCAAILSLVASALRAIVMETPRVAAAGQVVDRPALSIDAMLVPLSLLLFAASLALMIAMRQFHRLP